MLCSQSLKHCLGSIHTKIVSHIKTHKYTITCLFTIFRPDGKMVCPSFGFEECSKEDCGLDISDCEDKYFPDLFGQECRLEIDSLNPNTDFGNWQCQVFADDESVKSDIKIIKSKPAKIVFEDIYGEIEINLGKK